MDQPSPSFAVETAEEVFYRYQPAANGDGPFGCKGSTCLVRRRDEWFARGLETIPGAKPLDTCRWLRFHRPRAGRTQ